MEKIKLISIPYGLRPNKMARSYKVIILSLNLKKKNRFKEDDQKHMVATRREALVGISILDI